MNATSLGDAAAAVGGLVLHGFFRSSAAFRVRIALRLKGLEARGVSYRLREGAQRSPSYLALNPQGLVPMLELPGGVRLTQSLAIVEWLDEAHPDPPLLPRDPLARARVRSLAHAIAVDTHPLVNLRVLQRLGTQFGADDAAQAEWARHWIGDAFAALEISLARDPATGRFCHGDTPTLADICLVPQIVGAARFSLDVGAYPTVERIGRAALALDAFRLAAPAAQPDAE